jgi:hypothetical protein
VAVLVVVDRALAQEILAVDRHDVADPQVAQAALDQHVLAGRRQGPTGAAAEPAPLALVAVGDRGGPTAEGGDRDGRDDQDREHRSSGSDHSAPRRDRRVAIAHAVTGRSP